MTRGFTLMEMLVAIIVFTFIASGIYALLQTGTDLSQRGAHHARMFQSGRAALRAVENDIRGAWGGNSPFDTGFKGVRSSTNPPTDTLELVAFNNAPPTTGTTSLTESTPRELDLARVTWQVDLDPGTGARGLARDKKKLFGETAVATRQGENLETVVEDVVGLAFKYWDGSQWTDSWDSTVSMTLPKAVEITVHVKLAYKGQEETETFTSRAYLPIAATTPKKETE